MEKAKFDINPHVIRQLGAELVSDQVTALMELIKNSYDADASYVKIEINTVDRCGIQDLYNPNHKGYILVEDNGFGMDQATILKSWLIISYSNKRAVDGIKPKTPLGRTPLGDKGLGRLSTQRLANCCEIYTKKTDSSPFHVGFKWSDFDTVERLGEVNVNFQPTEFKGTSGTKMYLLDLIDTDCWKGEGLERLKGALCQIIAPYKELKPFNIYLSVNGDIIDITQEISKLEQLNLCDINFNYFKGVMDVQIDIHLRKLIGNDYHFYQKFIVTDNGKRFEEFLFNDKRGRGKCFERSTKGYWLQSHLSFDLKSLLPKQDLYSDNTLDDPGDFFGRIQEFYFGAQDKEGDWWNELYKNFKEYKSFVQSQTGIKIYRNGFAVRPYGIDDNDWLLLGQGQTGGSSYYGLRPGNVVGYVAIDEAKNMGLRDKTDREGLIENASYRNFYKLISEVVRRYSENMENLRRCYADFRSSFSVENTKIRTMSQAFTTISMQAQKGSATSKAYDNVQKKFVAIENKINKVVKSESSSLFSSSEDSLLRKTLEEVQIILSESKNVLTQANEILNDSMYLNEALQIIEPRLETLESQLTDFSELASLGLISEMVTHDLSLISNKMLSKSIDLDKQLKSNVDITKSQLYSLVDFIKSTVSSIRSQMKHLDPSLKYNREKQDVFSVKELLSEEEIPYYINKLQDKRINITLQVENDFMVSINKGRIMQVFDNLINNSVYWLEKRFESTELHPTPLITITVDKPWVYVEDNGEGIDKSVATTLFEPFVTRKPRGEGRGLGLFIVRQLLDSCKCDIYLDDSINEKGNQYRFSINLHEIIYK